MAETLKEKVGITEDYALEEVPQNKRRGLWETTAVMFGWVVSISAFMTGGTIGAGTTATEGLLAVLAGNLFLVVVASLVGLVGYKTGLTTYSIIRIIFGRKGSVILSLLLGVLAMGFIGVLMNSFGLAFNSLIPAVPVWAAVLVFAVFATATAIYGFKGLSFISKIALPTLTVFMTIAVIAAVKHAGGLGVIFGLEPSEPIPFVTAMGAAIATWITGAALTNDVTRYAKKASHVVIGAFIGYIGGAALFEGVSVLTAIGVGDGDVVKVMSTLGLLVPGIIVLVLALWTTTDNNIYSSSLAFSNLGEIINLKLSKSTWVIVAIIIALIVSLAGLASSFLTWLNLIGTIIPPFVGVLISHFWILHRKDTSFTIIEYRVSAIVAFVASVLIAYFSNVEVPAIIGIASGLVIYAILGKIMDKQSGDKQIA